MGDGEGWVLTLPRRVMFARKTGNETERSRSDDDCDRARRVARELRLQVRTRRQLSEQKFAQWHLSQGGVETYVARKELA